MQAHKLRRETWQRSTKTKLGCLLTNGVVAPHTPDDCWGASGGAIDVVITDASGGVHTPAVNTAGNFTLQVRGGIPTPYTAKVVANGKTRAMSTPQTNGDCNECHTQTGAQSAPGRIMAP